MKSSAKENRRLETSCKECVFAIYNNETQTGCKHERVGKFRDRDELIEAYDDDKEFYVISRVCNYFRSQKWNSGAANIEKAVEESSGNFCVVVDIPSMYAHGLEKTVDSIKGIEYDKFSVVLSHSMSLCSEQRGAVALSFQSLMDHGIKATINQYVAEKMQFYETLRGKECTHITVLKCGERINANLFDLVNSDANDKLNRAVFYRLGDHAVIPYYTFLSRYKIGDSYDQFVLSLEEESLSLNLHTRL